MHLKKQLADKLKAAAEYQARIKAGAELSEEETAAVKGILTDIETLKAQVDAADEKADVLERLASVGDSVAPADGNGEAPAKSLGEHFVKSLEKAGFKGIDKNRTFVAPEFAKANTDIQLVGNHYGPLLTDVDRDGVMPYRRKLTVAQLFSQGTISGNAVTYPVFGKLEGEFKTVGEAAQKPQLHFADPTWATEGLKEIAGFITLSDLMLEDLPYIATQINTELLAELMISEENQLLAGDGAGTNVKGILNREGVQTVESTKANFADDLAKAKMQVETGTLSRFKADGMIMHPDDYLALLLQKDGNQQYYGGGFFQNAYGNGSYEGEPAVWLLPTVTTTAIAKGTALVGAFKSAKVLRKGGVQVRSADQHDKNFTNDLVTVRAKERLTLEVKYPAAFTKVTISDL
ncbi:phage major capsid protein [Arcanobacterium canis]